MKEQKKEKRRESETAGERKREDAIALSNPRRNHHRPSSSSSTLSRRPKDLPLLDLCDSGPKTKSGRRVTGFSRKIFFSVEVAGHFQSRGDAKIAVRAKLYASPGRRASRYLIFPEKGVPIRNTVSPCPSRVGRLFFPRAPLSGLGDLNHRPVSIASPMTLIAHELIDKSFRALDREYSVGPD